MADDGRTQDRIGSSAHDEEGSRATRTFAPVWTALPRPLRVASVACGCFLLIAATAYVLGLILVRLAPLSLALAATLFLAALLQPVQARLQRLRLPRPLAALGTLLVLLTAVLGPLVLVWNLAADQFADLAAQLGEGAARIRDLLTSGGSPLTPEQLDRLTTRLRAWLTGQAGGIGAGARTLVETLGAILLVIVLLFFTLKDGDRMWDWVVNRVPARSRAPISEAGLSAWETLSRYARGTMAIAAIDAVGIGAALLALRVPLAFPLALIVFLGAFVPIIGATVAGGIAVLVALAANGPVTALLTAAAVIVVQQVEGNLLEPLIMKRQVRLHPFVVLVAVTAGTLTWGIAGAFIAVPVVAVAYQVAVILTSHRSKPVAPIGNEA